MQSTPLGWPPFLPPAKAELRACPSPLPCDGVPPACREAGGQRARAGPNTYGCLLWSTGAQWLSRAHVPAVGYKQTQRGVSPPPHSAEASASPEPSAELIILLLSTRELLSGAGVNKG